jgi:hypothetical protein
MTLSSIGLFPVKYTTATIVVFSVYPAALHIAEQNCGKSVFPQKIFLPYENSSCKKPGKGSEKYELKNNCLGCRLIKLITPISNDHCLCPKGLKE